MKKILSLIMAFLLSTSVCLFSSCAEKPCEHSFGEWETVKEASCVAGEKQRVCGNCEFTETEEIPASDDFFAHTFDENTLCTTCGYQEFIESEEYIENITIPNFFVGPLPCIIWWNHDRTYALKISLGNPQYLFLQGYVGAPVHVRLPAYYNGAPLGNIGLYYDDEPQIFQNCTTLKSIYIPNTVTRIEDYAFDGCTNLETVRFSQNLDEIGKGAFRNCISLKILYFKNNNRILSHTYDYRYDPTFENCLSLTEIYFPLSYDMSGSTNAFSSCTALKKIYVSAERYETYVKRFENFPNNLEIIIY